MSDEYRILIGCESTLAPTDEKFEETQPLGSCLKLCIVGEETSGKTVLIHRYASPIFSYDYKQSLGVGFAIKDILIENQQCKLVLWDIDSRPTFRSVWNLYLRGAHGGLLVFNLADPDALKTLRTWHTAFHRSVPDGAIVLAGTRITPTNQRQITPKAIKTLQKEWKVPYIETSITTGQGIEGAFTTLASAALTIAKQRLSQNSL